MLSPYRVLDLTDERAALGPMLLADLGADVIRVDPPNSTAPPDASSAGLHGHAFNRNKRSVALDLDAAEGKAAFLALVGTADFLFENAVPGAMAARGLGYDDLIAVNPRLVYVATTPFGQDGPYAGHAATDLTLAAMGGMAAVNGNADRAPVRMSVPQTWLHAAAESAVAALVAHQRRLQTGAGQFVDVSVQAATFWTTLNASIAAAVQGHDFERNGSIMQLSTVSMQTMYPCKDGSIVFLVNRQSLQVIVPWLVEEGIVPESWLTDEDWATYDLRLLSQQPIAHPIAEVIERIEAFTSRYTKAELFERGHARGMFLAPSNTVADVLAFAHLYARDYWQPFTTADGRTVLRPGPFVRLSHTPITYRYGTPAPGEHTDEVLGALPIAAAGKEVPA